MPLPLDQRGVPIQKPLQVKAFIEVPVKRGNLPAQLPRLRGSYRERDFSGCSLLADHLTIVCVSFELTVRERRSVMRRIWWARGFIVLLLVSLVFGWMMGGPIFPRVIGTILNLLWTAGMVMYIRRQQQRLNRSPIIFERSCGSFDPIGIDGLAEKRTLRCPVFISFAFQMRTGLHVQSDGPSPKTGH